MSWDIDWSWFNQCDWLFEQWQDKCFKKLWKNGLLLYTFCIHIIPWVLVAVRHIAADSGLRHVAHNTHSPVNLDLLRADLYKLHSAHSVSESFSHLFHCAVTADIKKVWLQILAARISSDKEQGASKVRRAFTAVSVEIDRVIIHNRDNKHYNAKKRHMESHSRYDFM